MTKKVYTTGEVATLCDVGINTVARWVDTGLLPGYRMPGGKERRIPRATLVQFLQSNGMPLGPLEQTGFRVLLVGVEASLHIRLAADLPEEVFVVLSALDSYDAGRQLGEDGVSVAVVDMRVSRYEATQILAHVVASDFVALAGEDEADPASLRSLGFDHVLKKPFDPSALPTLVRKLSLA